jgi:hypothetical protein
LFEIDVQEVDRQAELEEWELVTQARELEHEFFADDDAEEHIPDKGTSGRKRKAEAGEPLTSLSGADEEEDTEDGGTVAVYQRLAVNPI